MDSELLEAVLPAAAFVRCGESSTRMTWGALARPPGRLWFRTSSCWGGGGACGGPEVLGGSPRRTCAHCLGLEALVVSDFGLREAVLPAAVRKVWEFSPQNLAPIAGAFMTPRFSPLRCWGW